MINILIVDDEDDALENLERKLSRLKFELNIQKATGVLDALKLLKNNSYELVLLDIQMSDGTGFDILEQTQKRDFHVIFVTAYDNYAIKAFKFHAFDYLLKPIDFEDLEKSVTDLLCNPENDFLKLNQRDLTEIKPDEIPHRITIPYKTGFVYIDVKDIIYLSADGSYTTVHTSEKRYVVAKKIKFFEELLDETGFCRIHASHIINLHWLKLFTKRNGGEVKLDNGIVLSVSRSRRENLLNALNK